jgi:hypothetical protein
MVGGLALLIGVPGLIHPPLVRWVYVATSVVSFPIGWVVSHVLLALIFYLLITPLGILRRVFGRDALQLRRPTGETYWMEKKPVTDPARYLKQF